MPDLSEPTKYFSMYFATLNFDRSEERNGLQCVIFYMDVYVNDFGYKH